MALIVNKLHILSLPGAIYWGVGGLMSCYISKMPHMLDAVAPWKRSTAVK